MNNRKRIGERTRISMGLCKSDVEQLRRLSSEHDLSVAWIVGHLIKKFLADPKIEMAGGEQERQA